MSRIQLQRSHELGMDAALAAARRIAEELAEDYGVETEWDGYQARFSGAGISGALDVQADSVELTMRLGLLLLPFRHRIMEAMHERLDQELGGQGPETST